MMDEKERVGKSRVFNFKEAALLNVNHVVSKLNTTTTIWGEGKSQR